MLFLDVVILLVSKTPTMDDKTHCQYITKLMQCDVLHIKCVFTYLSALVVIPVIKAKYQLDNKQEKKMTQYLCFSEPCPKGWLLIRRACYKAFPHYQNHYNYIQHLCRRLGTNVATVPSNRKDRQTLFDYV